MSRPLALTWGDPAGVGGEIAVKAWAHGQRDFFLIADLERFARLFPDQPLHAWTGGALPTDSLAILDHPCPAPVTPGTPEHANAPAIIEMIARAVALVGDGTAAALVTNPISKEVLKKGAGFAFPGHTEYLADLAGIPLPVMMLAAPELRVVPVTIHIPLSEVPAHLTASLLEDTIRVTHAAMIRDFGIKSPRIAVAGLNPHAGEGGLMGREEIEIIAPVLARLSEEGIALQGPMSADTMFHPPARARYDVAVCMYHDQALIPIKTVNFSGGVNATLGLPFVRTSPDHGTAFDIAGTGRADPDSVIAALGLASRMAAARVS